MKAFDLIGAQRRIFSSTLKPLERLVALALVDHWSKASDRPYPSISRLEQWTGLCRHAVLAAVRGLEAAGAINVHTPTRGARSTYDIAGLMALPPDQCTRRTSAPDAPVHQTHSTSAPDAPQPVHQTHSKEPRKEPIMEPKIPEPLRLEISTPVTKSKRRTKNSDPSSSTTESAHREVVEAYFQAFKAQHGREPTFDGADGTAVKRLLAKLKGDGTEACRRVRNAFTTFRARSVTIRDIASKPDAFASPEVPKGVDVQRSPADQELVARMRAQGRPYRRDQQPRQPDSGYQPHLHAEEIT